MVLTTLALLYSGNTQTQIPHLLTKPVAAVQQSKQPKSINTKSVPRKIKNSPSRHKTGRSFMNTSKVTCFTVAENGRSTANGEHCFSNGPEYMCALPSNLNPGSVYCKHRKGICRPIHVLTNYGQMIDVHVVDHCPQYGVIDLNPSAANKIFLNKDSSRQDWWSKSTIKWIR